MEKMLKNSDGGRMMDRNSRFVSEWEMKFVKKRC